MATRHVDVAIIGGGISGTALLYLLARYTDLPRIALLEKLPTLARLNSHGRNNSQTLHCGDIETNYTLEKALQVQATAQMVVRYAEALPERDRLLYRYPKMVLGVGEGECSELRERFARFSPHYPDMRLLEREAIARFEPALVEGRRDAIVALATRDSCSAVDFHALAHSFAEQARAQGEARIDLRLATPVREITPAAGGYRIRTDGGELQADFVVVSAGAHSLLYAQRMGYGLEYSCLPIAGSFYYTPPLLRGKVYTVQNPKLPFAAIHGDPDILQPGKTRFGPTALALPLLERHNLRTLTEYLEVLRPDMDVVRVILDLLREREIRNYMFKNILFEVPLVRRRLFLREAQRIVPSLRLADLTFARGIGGIRPVLIDKPKRRLHLGEARIAPQGAGIIFNMTPSPGATSCLGNAKHDLGLIAATLHCRVDQERLHRELLAPAT